MKKAAEGGPNIVFHWSLNNYRILTLLVHMLEAEKECWDMTQCGAESLNCGRSRTTAQIVTQRKFSHFKNILNGSKGCHPCCFKFV